MDKEKKNIFDTDLNSLMNDQLIEVDGVGSGMSIADIIQPATGKEKEKQDADTKAKADSEAQMIDLDTEKEEVEDSEEEEEEIQEAPSSDKTTPQTKSKTSSPLTPYAKLLKDEGILPNMDVEKFDGTAESLKEAMVEEIIGAVEVYKDSLPDRIKNLINNYEEGIPLERLLEIDRSETEISKVTEDKLEEDVSLQKKIVSDYLKRTTKFSESKISKMVDGYEDGGDLEDEAKSSLKELKTLVEDEKKAEMQNVERARKLEEEQRKKDMAALNSKVREAKEIIPGLKLNDKIKGNVLASMTQAVGYDKAGNPVNKIVAARMEDPMEFEIKLHYLFEITNGFKDFSKLAEKGKKDSVQSFEKAIGELDKTNESVESKGLNIKSSPKTQNFLKGLEKTFNI